MDSVRSFTRGGRLAGGLDSAGPRAPASLVSDTVLEGMRKSKGNFCGHRDRLAILDERLELPFLRRIRCGLGQNGVSADDLDACHIARFRN